MTGAAPPPAPITLGDGTAWDVDLPPAVIGLHVLHLLNHDFSAAEQWVFPQLGIDRGSRRRTGRAMTSTLHDYRWRNKALAMELLVALLFSRIDSPVGVQSACLTDPATGLPDTFAPSGRADVSVSYRVRSPERTVRIVVEASAMRFMPIDNFRAQLTQAVKHARDLQEPPVDATYALVVNTAPILRYKGFHEMYRAILQREGVADDPSIRLVAINAAELALALCDLAASLPADQFPFRTEQLFDVLDTLYEGLRRRQSSPNPEWMRKVWSDIIVDGVAPELALPEEPGDDAAGGPAGEAS
ncbi:MAG: hypothetical protein F4Y02_02335 [Chloroflexi bacterium]|nr:hypothetical protein [Chloroflexota bacterium]